MTGEEFITVFIISLIILAGVAVMIVAMLGRHKEREMMYRERLAMIERGVIASPESDPKRFEAAMHSLAPVSTAGVRFRTAGVILIGFGFALMTMLAFSVKEPGLGVGIGGAWVIIGLASLLNYYLISRREDDLGGGLPTRWAPPPPRPPNSPSNGAP